jgi:hypothetical protein
MDVPTFSNRPQLTVTIYYFDKKDKKEVEAAFLNLDYIGARTGQDYRRKTNAELLKEFLEDDDVKPYRFVRKEEWIPWPDQIPHPSDSRSH